MKTCVHLYHLAEFFLELEMLHTKVVEKIKTYVLFNDLSRKIVPFMR